VKLGLTLDERVLLWKNLGMFFWEACPEQGEVERTSASCFLQSFAALPSPYKRSATFRNVQERPSPSFFVLKVIFHLVGRVVLAESSQRA
jgi:hypothetical protein